MQIDTYKQTHRQTDRLTFRVLLLLLLLRELLQQRLGPQDQGVLLGGQVLRVERDDLEGIGVPPHEIVDPPTSIYQPTSGSPFNDGSWYADSIHKAGTI